MKQEKKVWNIIIKKGTTLPKLAFEKLVSDLNYDLAKIIEKNILNYKWSYVLYLPYIPYGTYNFHESDYLWSS